MWIFCLWCTSRVRNNENELNNNGENALLIQQRQLSLRSQRRSEEIHWRNIRDSIKPRIMNCTCSSERFEQVEWIIRSRNFAGKYFCSIHWTFILKTIFILNFHKLKLTLLFLLYLSTTRKLFEFSMPEIFTLIAPALHKHDFN